MAGDLRALLITFAYVCLVVAAGEVLRRGRVIGPGGARRLVHAGVGLWAWGTWALFSSPWWAALPPAVFVLVNYLTRRLRLMAYDAADAASRGTVLFPLAFALLLPLTWGEPRHYLLALSALALADPAANLVGRRWGAHPYRAPLGGSKSLEGSLALFLVALLTSFVALSLVFGLSLAAALGQATILAAVAAAAEGLGGHGSDNLLLPLAVAGAGWLLVHPLAAPVVSLLGLAALLALAVGLLGYARGALAPSGVLGAVLVGAPCFALGGAVGTVALLAFFISSSLLSHAFLGRKRPLAEEYAKGSRRDLAQALANGGAAAVLAALGYALHSSALVGGAVASLAAANADTWATELGGAFGGTPRLVTSGRRVPPGTSGAVSLAGLLAAAAGALFVGGCAAVALWFTATGSSLDTSIGRWLLAVGLAGLAGSLVDSLLGASVQAVYYCPHCKKETEQRVHRCGTPASLRRGAAWINNDVVNLLAVSCGGLFGYLLIH